MVCFHPPLINEIFLQLMCIITACQMRYQIRPMRSDMPQRHWKHFYK